MTVESESSSTIEKALDILFHLHDQGQPLGVTAIARALAMPKSSVHRLLGLMVKRGLVEQNQRAHYQPGMALIALGLGALSREPLAAAARPLLEQAASDIGETFFLVIARAGRLLVLDKAEGNGFLRAAPQIGSSVPVHATAVGKLYLCHAPDLVPHDEFNAFTRHTITDSPRLEAALAQVRQQGWASNIDEWQMGLGVLAAPIFLNGTGMEDRRLLGAVALAMSSAQMRELGIERLARRVQHTAEGVALRLEGKS